MNSIELVQPDDWHLHLRDGANLAAVVTDTARQFARAIIMPNLKPPVTTVVQARAYRDRIVAALSPGTAFEPLMTLYLTEAMAPAEIRAARESGVVHAVKYYPAGATTNSENGVTDLRRVYPVLAELEKQDIPLLLHGEVTDPEIDIFDREAVFVERHLAVLVREFPALRLVLEHVTTVDGIAFVEQSGPNIAATLTAHHLLWNRNDMLVGGVRPHTYCLPVLKRDTHRQALVRAATGGNPKFFLGTDSAPHGRRSKETACGCAGVYSAGTALELYAEVFDAAGALSKLESFASFHGPDFYRLPRNSGRVRIVRQPSVVPQEIPFGNDVLVPMRAGESLSWTFAGLVA